MNSNVVKPIIDVNSEITEQPTQLIAFSYKYIKNSFLLSIKFIILIIMSMLPIFA